MLRHLPHALLALLLALGACKRERPAPPPVPTPSRAWLAGVLEPEAGRTPVRGGTLTLRVPSEPPGLNRLHDRMRDGHMTRYTMGPLYETLLEIDRASGALQPCLAESWTVSGDGRVHTFRLREGVTFHDGAPFSARDVKATLDVVMRQGNLTEAIRSAFTALASWEAPDARTFVLRWKQADYYGFRTFAAGVPIMPAGALEADFNTSPLLRHPVGTGPFRFESWQSGHALTLVRNPTYWRQPAWLERVVVRFVADATLAAQLFEKGEFDLMTMIAPAQWRALEAPTPANAWAIQGWQRIRGVENSFSYVGWNVRRPQLADRRVRQALAHLYPGEEVARAIDLGLEPRTTCPFYRLSSLCDAAVQPLPYDMARARALLEEAGWRDADGDGVRERDGARLELTLLVVSGSAKMGRLAPLLQEHLRRAGVALKVERLEWAAYQQRLRAHTFDAVALQWADTDSEHDVFPIFHSSQAEALNYGGYAHPEADRLMEALRVEMDPARRTGLGRRLHRLLYEEQPYLFLTNRPTLDAASRRVHGLMPSLAGYDLRRVWVDPEARAEP
jgi:peptide/nickel transport system substrate-binding protein